VTEEGKVGVGGGIRLRTLNPGLLLCAAGDWRVGYKRAYDLFPGGLQKRITGERKKRRDERQRVAVSKANSDLAQLSAEYGKVHCL